MKNFCLTIFSPLLFYSIIYADEFAGTFHSTGAQLQAISMGKSFTATASGTMAPNRNPAGLVQTKGSGVHAILNSASLDRRSHNLSAFINLRGDVGFGFSWLHAQVNNIRGRSSSGQFTGKIEDGANAFTISFAFKIGNALKAGLSMKSINHRISGPFHSKGEASGHGFDFGLQYVFNEKGSFGMTVKNINSALNWKVKRGDKTRNTRDSIKPRISVGAVYSPIEELHLGGDFIIEHSKVGTVGASWKINQLLSISLGLREIGGTKKLGYLSNGFSLHPMRNKNVILHYAYVTDPLGAGELTIVGLESNF